MNNRVSVVAYPPPFDPPLTATVWYSDDNGSSWYEPNFEQLVTNTRGDDFSPEYGAGLTASGDHLVAVVSGSTNPPGRDGASQIWSSADGGETWALSADLPPTTAPAVFPGGPGFLALRWDGNRRPRGPKSLWSSVDGIEWEMAADGLFEDFAVTDVAELNGTYLAVGGKDPFWQIDPEAWVSADGRMWESIKLPKMAGTLRAIATADERFLIVGSVRKGSSTPAAWLSADARNWTAVAIGGDKASVLSWAISNVGTLLFGHLESPSYGFIAGSYMWLMGSADRARQIYLDFIPGALVARENEFIGTGRCGTDTNSRRKCPLIFFAIPSPFEP